MAEDTRDNIDSTPEAREMEQTNPQDPSSQPKKPKYDMPKSQVGKLWDAFGNPEDQVNTLSTYNGAGKDSKNVSVTESIKSISLKDASTFYKAPCARDSLLLGIGAGFGVGGVRGIIGGVRSMWTACNWAVGAFAITALATHEFCQRRRTQELDGMKQAVDLMHQLKVKKQRQKEEKAAETARLAEEERQRKSWTHLSNYKFW